MRVSIIGTGYVGLVSGTCFAELGHEVHCIDIDRSKIERLQKGECPIYEPGLSELILRNKEQERLFFSADYSSVGKAQIIFLAVGTPSLPSGAANLDYLHQAAKAVARELSTGALVVVKSTVPVGTNEAIKKVMMAETKTKFHLVSNPEFLKEGVAVADFMKPDRVVVGASDEFAFKMMEELYAPLMLQGNPIIKMSVTSAELTKYAANCFLATKISFINEIARLCDASGADIEEVRKGMTSDKRIGNFFLYPGVGYGGSCFPKDVEALIHTAKELGSDLRIVKSAKEVNDSQKIYLFKKILSHFKGDLAGKVFAFWGVSFKPNTDDIREAPALVLAEVLVAQGAKVRFYDPVANNNFSKAMAKWGDSVQVAKEKYECVRGAHALVLVTEWTEFRAPDFKLLKEELKSEVIFDGRNLYDMKKVLESGLTYYAIGRKVH